MKLLPVLLSVFCIHISVWSQECTNYAGIEDVVFFEEEICFGGCTFFDVTFLTNGEPIGETYSFEIYGSDGSTGFGFGDDFGFGFGDICFELEGQCEPVSIDITMDVLCDATGEIFESGIIVGTVIVYPDLFVNVEYPGCGEGENGVAYLMNSFTGEPCSEQIMGTAGIPGSCEESTPATLAYSFTVFEGTLCETIYTEDIVIQCGEGTYGCTNPEACNYNLEATCDDGSCIIAAECCPRPIGFPEALCAGFYEICIEFDGDVTGIEFFDIYDSNGYLFGFGDPPTGSEVCFEIDVFLFEECIPEETEVFISYDCPIEGFVDYSFGSVILYPDPSYFIPILQLTNACSEPIINPGFCGEILSIEIIPPVNDCENPILGEIIWTIDPGFEITVPADCFPTTGSIELPPCLEDCPCEGFICDGICSDVTVLVVGDFPPAACAFDGALINVEFVGLGADYGNYSIEFSSTSNSFLDFTFHDPGDPTEYSFFFFSDSGSCLPVEEEITYVISCPSTGEVMASGSLGFITVYPDPYLFYPQVLDAYECGDIAQVVPGPCGYVMFEPSDIVFECGASAETQFSDWSVDFGFEYDETLICSPGPIEGQVSQAPCFQEIGEPCLSECKGEGVMNADCMCEFDNAQGFNYSGPSLFSVCTTDILSVELDIINGNQDLEIEITDYNFIFDFYYYSTGDPSPITVDIFPFSTNQCGLFTTSIYATAYCTSTYTIVDGPTYIGELTIYPELFDTEIMVIPASECGMPPEIISTGCGTVVIDNIIPPLNDPDNPVDGLIEYSLDLGFDPADAPACYDLNLFSGSTVIEACNFIIPPDCSASYQSVESISLDNANLCGGGCVVVTFDIVDGGDVMDNSYSFDVIASNGTIASGLVSGGQGSAEICFDDVDCNPVSIDLTLSIYCDDFLLDEAIDLGTITNYPSLSIVAIQITPATECGEQPQITNSGCGSIIILNITPPVNFPDSPVTDGAVEYTFDFGFDPAEAPDDCYDLDLFSGSAVIPACTASPCDADNGTLSIRIHEE